MLGNSTVAPQQKYLFGWCRCFYTDDESRNVASYQYLLPEFTSFNYQCYDVSARVANTQVSPETWWYALWYIFSLEIRIMLYTGYRLFDIGFCSQVYFCRMSVSLTTLECHCMCWQALFKQLDSCFDHNESIEKDFLSHIST